LQNLKEKYKKAFQIAISVHAAKGNIQIIRGTIVPTSKGYQYEAGELTKPDTRKILLEFREWMAVLLAQSKKDQTQS
jgi:hypothetical protein